MVIPPPVKFIASLAVLLEAMLQPGAMMFGLPWKLIEPVNAKAHAGVGNDSTSAMAVAPMLTVDKPSSFARYVGCCWLTMARTRLLVG